MMLSFVSHAEEITEPESENQVITQTETSTQVVDKEELREVFNEVMEDYLEDVEVQEVDVYKPTLVDTNSPSNVRKVQIWQFYLFMLYFAFEVITWADNKFEKSFRRMGKD